MVAYLKSMGMTFHRGGANSWSISKKKLQRHPLTRIKICSGSWFFLIRGEIARVILNIEEMKEINWKSLNFCSGCTNCKPGIELNVFGKKFVNVCAGRMFEYRDLNAEMMKIIMGFMDKLYT